jgi:nicotinate phosphoribosyltransferase
MKAFKENGVDDSYAPGYGIRLDSGDLAYLSTECRHILDENGYTKCKIFATNSLDEYLITDLERQGACIDSYGVGDAIATSKANPCFGNVYKLVEIDGEAVLKRSEDKIKLINPGNQITYRIMIDDPAKGEIYKVDVTCLKGDELSKKIEAGEGFTVCNEHDRYLTKTFEAGEYTAMIMQHKVIENGVRCDTKYTILEKKEYFNRTLMHFSPSERRLINPHYYKVDISDDPYNLKMGIIEKLVKEIRNFDK